jgi:hypothetical protein
VYFRVDEMRGFLIIFLSLFSCSVFSECKIDTLSFNEKTNEGFICSNLRDWEHHKDIANSFCKRYYSLVDDVQTSYGGFSFSCMAAMFQSRIKNPKENILESISDVRDQTNSPKKYNEFTSRARVKVDSEKESFDKIDAAKIKCINLGYVKGSDKFKKCVLELFQ